MFIVCANVACAVFGCVHESHVAAVGLNKLLACKVFRMGLEIESVSSFACGRPTL